MRTIITLVIATFSFFSTNEFHLSNANLFINIAVAKTTDPERDVKVADASLKSKANQVSKNLRMQFKNLSKSMNSINNSYNDAYNKCAQIQATGGNVQNRVLAVNAADAAIKKFNQTVVDFESHLQSVTFSEYTDLKSQVCDLAVEQANKWCGIATYTPYAISLLSPILGQLSQSSGSQKEQCKKAAQISQIGTIINGTILGACQLKRFSCKSHCEYSLKKAYNYVAQIENYKKQIQFYTENLAKHSQPCQSAKPPELTLTTDKAKELKSQLEDAIPSCTATQINPMTLITSIGQLGYTIQASKACEAYLDENETNTPCMGDENFSNPDCPGFCTLPENSQHSRCVAATDLCQGPAGKYSQQCICLEDPTAPGCNTGTNSNGPQAAGSLASSDTNGVDLDDDEFFENTPEIEPGNPNGGQKLGFSGGNKGGGGGLGSGGGGFGPGGGGGGNRGPGKGPYDTDVIGGYGKAGSGSGNTGAGEGYAGGAGNGYSNGGLPRRPGNYNSPKIDLKKYLPKKRAEGIAAKNKLNKDGICFQSCESNWIRVRRATYKKKNTMMPGM